MKYFFSVMTALAITAFSSPAHADRSDELGPVLLTQAPEEVYAPMGFDNNDNAQLVLYGNLKNTCHKTGPIRQRIDHGKRVIYLKNQVYFYSGCWCAQVTTPFVQTVDLGVLKNGAYDVVVETEDGSFKKMASLPVAISASRSPDDYLYAPVESVVFSKAGGGPALLLSGTFTNTCMQLLDVKVTYRPNRVVEVQPIVSLRDDGCRRTRQPFHTTVDLDASRTGRALIHVRSLNGKSINQVVEL